MEISAELLAEVREHHPHLTEEQCVDLIERIQKGLGEAERGETVYLGSFEQYLEDDEAEHRSRVKAATERVARASEGLSERLADE